MRRAQNADTHALDQHRLSQNSSPVCSSIVLVIASDMHLEPESEKGAKNVDFHTVKISRYKRPFFAVFRPILINWLPTYLLWSDHKIGVSLALSTDTLWWLRLWPLTYCVYDTGSDHRWPWACCVYDTGTLCIWYRVSTPVALDIWCLWHTIGTPLAMGMLCLWYIICILLSMAGR